MLQGGTLIRGGKERESGTALSNHKSDKGSFIVDIRRQILRIYNDRRTTEMLSKCLHGRTQNANEQFNGMKWNGVTKRTHDGQCLMSVGV